MREIKFRFWSGRTKVMSEALTLGQIMRSAVISDGDVEIRDVMQYTGLNDKNGVEICEGDIVRASGSNSLWTVGYEAPKFTVTVVSLGITAELYADIQHEVIGNIYENPELLEKAA